MTVNAVIMQQPWRGLIGGPKDEGSPKLREKTGAIKELMARYTQHTSDKKSESSKLGTEGGIFRSSERPQIGPSGFNFKRQAISEHPKKASQSDRAIFVSTREQNPNSDPNKKNQLKSAFQKTRESKRSVTFEDIELTGNVKLDPLSSGYPSTKVNHSHRHTVPAKTTEKEIFSKNIKSHHVSEDPKKRETSIKGDTYPTLNLIPRNTSLSRESARSSRMVVDGDKVVKSFGNTVRNSLATSEGGSIRGSEAFSFDQRRATNKYKMNVGHKEKKRLEALRDSEVYTQNAMDRLLTTGRIRNAEASIHDRNAASELMNKGNYFGKLVTFRVAELLVVRGMNIAKIEVVAVDEKYRKDLMLSKGDRLFGIFKHGSDISGLADRLHDSLLKVVDPSIVRCQRSTNLYCLIKYFRVDRL